MKPYYQDEWVTIYHGDCREILPTLEKVDLILADPPYVDVAQEIGKRKTAYTSDAGPDDFAAWCGEWFGIARDVCEKILLTPGTKNIWNYPPAKWVLCWHKPGAVGHSSVGGFNIWEPILVYGKGFKFGEDFFRQVALNLGTGPETKHACPKPPPLFRWLITKASITGETIVDPFLGSGTTVVAAKLLNRKSIGIEIEEKYCEIAAKRLSQSVMRLEL